MGIDNWTRTTGEKIAIRLTMMIYVWKAVGSNFKFGDINNDSIAYLILGKCIISMFAQGVFYFCIFKYIFRAFGLTNERNNVYVSEEDTNADESLKGKTFDHETHIDREKELEDGNKDIDYKKE